MNRLALISATIVLVAPAVTWSEGVFVGAITLLSGTVLGIMAKVWERPCS